MATQPERIHRTFLDIPDEGEVSDETTDIHLALGHKGLEWTGLLESKRVLIFSQAGVGKTFECQAEQKRLWDEGEPAFFLELAQLAKRDFRAMLSPEEELRFDAWTASPAQYATFFLDSYDELLLTLGSFRQALTALARVLAGKLGRARIVVTSRPLPLDEQLFRQILPIPVETVAVAAEVAFADIVMTGPAAKKADGSARLWRRVILAPLNKAEMRQMAVALGVADPDALLADIRRRNAESFARRPQDLIDLCADWRSARRLQTHRQQLTTDIELKLKPRTDSREKTPLSLDKALEGARRLALACLLTRKLTLRHSSAAETGEMDGAALDPGAILTDWSALEIDTLLERPLFGFASYGRVRFHHRSVIEFLAAKQLLHLLSNGMTRRALNRLILAETTQGLRVVKPSMRPVAAWMAGEDETVFEAVLTREPECLLNDGDPASLSSSQRRRALKAYVARYGPGGWRGISMPSIQVHRFADSELAPDILEAWKAGIESEETRELLLSIMAAGKIVACRDIAFEATMNSASAYGERVDAIEALIAIEDPRLPQAVADLVAGTVGQWNDRISRWGLMRLFPDHMSVNQTLVLMERLTESRREVTGISWQLPQIIAEADLTRSDLEALRAGLTTLVFPTVGVSEDGADPRSPRQFLVSSLAAVCTRLIAQGEAGAEVLRSAALALRLIDREYGEEKPSEVLRRTLWNGGAALREAAFIADDALAQSLDPKTDAWNRFYETVTHGPIRPDLSMDKDWVLRRLADAGESADLRALSLEAAFELSRSEPSPRAAIEDLRRHVSAAPALLDRIAERLRPARRSRRWAAWEARAAKRQERSRRKDLRHRASWIAFWREVSQHPDRVFSEDRSDNTVWNLWHAMARAGQNGRGSGWKREFLEQFFGAESADRLRIALMRFWRSERPTLVSEREPGERNTFMTSWQLGLAGISAEAEDPSWTDRLTVDEAALALRYVSVEFGGFPSWFDSLAQRYPQTVDEVMGGELTWELVQPPSELGHSMVLQNIRQASPETAALFLPRLWNWLNADDNAGDAAAPGSGGVSRLDQVTGILLAFGDENLKRRLLDLALAQMEAAPEGPGSRVWLTAVLRLSPACGIEILDTLLREVEIAPRGAGVQWFATLFGDRFDGPRVDLDTEEFTPDILLRLVRIGYRHVRPSDDAVHVGSYSPDLRDHAERGRHAVLGALLAAKGTAAWTAKLELAADPLCAHFQDRIRTLARERAAEEVDGSAAEEAEIVTLNRVGELPPITRDDMFAIMTDRLADLEDLLLRDDSPRQTWAAIKDEATMRREIARELRHTSRQAYTVDQEAVTADDKETDIRLRSVVSEQQAVIELKIGEKPRSVRDLKAALRSQLLTKYLAPETSRAGCLLITLGKTKRIWSHPDTGATLDLSGLIALLQTEADAIMAELAGTVRLTVIGLDLRPRLTTEKQAASRQKTKSHGRTRKP